MKVSKPKILLGIFELAIPTIFTFLLKEYVYRLRNNNAFELSFDVDTVYFIAIFYFLILFAEWYRRNKEENNKKIIQRYLFVLAILIAFILSLGYIQLYL